MVMLLAQTHLSEISACRSDDTHAAGPVAQNFPEDFACSRNKMQCLVLFRDRWSLLPGRAQLCDHSSCR